MTYRGISIANPTSPARTESIEPKLKKDRGVPSPRTTPKQSPRSVPVFSSKSFQRGTEAHRQLGHPPCFDGVMILARKAALTCEVSNMIHLDVSECPVVGISADSSERNLLQASMQVIANHFGEHIEIRGCWRINHNSILAQRRALKLPDSPGEWLRSERPAFRRTSTQPG